MHDNAYDEGNHEGPNSNTYPAWSFETVWSTQNKKKYNKNYISGQSNKCFYRHIDVPENPPECQQKDKMRNVFKLFKKSKHLKDLDASNPFGLEKKQEKIQ